MITDKSNEFFYATQWQLIRAKFVRHRLAVFSMFFLVILYLIAIFAGFIFKDLFIGHSVENNFWQKI